MSGNEQGALPENANTAPPEFQRFQEQVAQIFTHEPQTVDENIAKWMCLLEAWREHLSDSPYQEQATTLLRPLLMNCSVFYYQRYRESNLRTDLDQSIELARELVRTLKDDAPDVTKHLEHLGFVLTLRCSLTHSPEDMVELTTTWQHAITTAGDDDTRSKYLYTLGEVYKERYRLFHLADDLEKAIHSLEESARLDTSVTRNDPLNLQAFMLRERYQFTKDLNDLQRADLAWRESVSLLPFSDRTAPDKLLNISAIQARIYQITQQRSDLEEYIAYWKEILSRIPDNLEGKVVGQNFLGYCYAMRFGFTRNLEDLHEAVRHQEKAIALAVATPSIRLDYLHNLHIMLTKRIQTNPNEADIQRLQHIEKEIEQLQSERNSPPA